MLLLPYENLHAGTSALEIPAAITRKSDRDALLIDPNVRATAGMYHDLGAIISGHQIECSVMNGIDPITSAFGRDLDVYVSHKADAHRLVRLASSKLAENRFTWSTPVHPIWGPRCIGVRESEYCELHFTSLIRLGHLDLGRIVDLEASEGPFGLPFDPAHVFFKLVLKHHRAMLRGLPIWNGQPPPAFVMNHRSSIIDRLERAWPLASRFAAVVLASDSEANQRLRRRLILGLMLGAWPRDPISSAQLFVAQAQRRTNVYSSPCAPYVSILSSATPKEIQRQLDERIGHAFMKIQARCNPWSFRSRRQLQARQSLPIHVTADTRELDRRADLIFRFSDEQSDIEGFRQLSEQILERTMSMNARWQRFYEAN